jgi:hypothetical protein
MVNLINFALPLLLLSFNSIVSAQPAGPAVSYRPTVDSLLWHRSVMFPAILYSINPNYSQKWEKLLSLGGDETTGDINVNPDGTTIFRLGTKGSTTNKRLELRANAASNGNDLWKVGIPTGNPDVWNGYCINQLYQPMHGMDVASTNLSAVFSPDGSVMFFTTNTGAVTGIGRLHAIDTASRISNPSTNAHVSGVAIISKQKKRSATEIEANADFEDEHDSPVTVTSIEAIWTLPDGTQAPQPSGGGGGGGGGGNTAQFSIASAGPAPHNLKVTDDADLCGVTSDSKCIS